MAVVFALASALFYGVGDFVGGIAAKSASAWQVAVVGQISAIVCTSGAALALGGQPRGSEILWGVLAGVGMGGGASFLYRGLAHARMSVVAPVSGVVTAVLPVAVGLVFDGVPSNLALLGIACALPAIAFIARTNDVGPAQRAGLVDGTIAGGGFGLLLVALGQISASAGLYPLLVAQLSSILTVTVIATLLRQTWWPNRGPAWRASLIGPFSASATTAYLYSTRHGLLAVVAAISALYPASTVLLASLLLRERLLPWQIVGLATAAIAVTLVTIG